MPSPDSTRKLAAIGLLLMPVALVKLTGMYFGPTGPSAAHAAEADAAAPAAAASASKAPTWTDRQLDAGDYVAELRTRVFAATPFLYEAQPQSTTPTTTVSTDPVAPFNTETKPAFVLQAILKSSIGTTALIDGKPYQVGGQIRDSQWTIESIDANSRSATLRESNSNRTITIAVELPTLNSKP